MFQSVKYVYSVVSKHKKSPMSVRFEDLVNV